jgi:hypothetical protein
MIRRGFVPTLLLSLLLSSAPLAAAAAEDAAHKQVVGQYVDLQPVGLPIVVDGQLANYVFVYVRLNLAAGADTSRWRAKEPYFRDLLVRRGHETSFVVPSDYNAVDVPKLAATLTREFQTITGPGVIRSVVIVKQVPGHRARAPHA